MTSQSVSDVIDTLTGHCKCQTESMVWFPVVVTAKAVYIKNKNNRRCKFFLC